MRCVVAPTAFAKSTKAMSYMSHTTQYLRQIFDNYLVAILDSVVDEYCLIVLCEEPSAFNSERHEWVLRNEGASFVLARMRRFGSLRTTWPDRCIRRRYGSACHTL